MKQRKEHIYFLFVLIALVVLGFVLPRGARSLLVQIMILSIFAMGYDVSLGFTNQCSLGHSVLFGAGAYAMLLPILHLKTGLLVSVLFCLGGGFVFSLVTGIIAVRLSEAYFVIVTAIFSAIFHLLAVDLTWLTGGDDGLSATLPSLNLGAANLSLYDPMVNYFFALFFLALSYLVLRRIAGSPLGKIFLAIRENEKRAEYLGYHVTRYKLIAFVISGVFAALGGGLYALSLRYTTADFFSIYWSIIPIVWCLIGGLGTLVGPCLGVFLMSLFQYYVSAWWTYYLIIFGVLILLILRVSKGGIVGFIVGGSKGQKA
ncbi:MAG: branched-chain amino acid ABC transporter permease [Deltaproteobacteria bacterium]